MVSYIDILPEDIMEYIYSLAKNLKKHDNVVRFINNNFEYIYYSDYFFGEKLNWSKLKVSRRRTCYTGVLVEYRTYNYYHDGDARTLESVSAALNSVSLYNYDNILNSVDATSTTLELYDDYLSCVKATGYIDFSYDD